LVESGHPPRRKSSNNPLAVEPETENDIACESFVLPILRRVKISIQAAAQAKAKGIIEMFDTLKRDAMFCALTAALMLAVATPSLAQPSEAQKEAVKSACRSDYMAHCSSVTPGGEAALQCLAKNMSSLSSGCQSAVKAVEAAAAPKSEPAKTDAAPAAAPKTETAKPAAEAKPAATTAAKKPTDAQAAAIRSACRGDYPKVCAGVPTGGAPALECLEKNKAKVSASCGKALAAVSGGAAPAAGGAAPAAAGAAPAASPTVIVLRPMLPREELFVMRSACGGDIRTLCAGVAPGGGRIMQCIANRAADLSPACRDVLTPFIAR
jgi:sRNA-binding protein